MTARPLVSVLVPAYNLARFLPAALDSALGQLDPGGPIEIIVVDDGSTDETPELLADYGDRVRVLRQPNGGLVAAVQRGLDDVRGEFIALLDADDEWPAGRLARHVAILRDRPTVGLVHGDMELIDAAGETTHPSYYARERVTPPCGYGQLGRMIAQNHVAGGAATFRASLLPAITPFEPSTAFPDWRIAVGVASVAEVHYDPVSANRYRSHGANMGLDAPAHRPSQERREIPYRSWMLSEFLTDPTITVDEIREAVQRWRWAVVAASVGCPGGARALMEADARVRAARPADPDGRLSPGSLPALVRAVMHDPLDGARGFDLDRAFALAPRDAVPSPPPPLISLPARATTTLAALDEVTAAPELLDAYAEAAAGDEDATLVVLADPGSDLAPLVAQVERSPRLADEALDITVLTAPGTPPARALLASGAAFALTGLAGPEYAGLPAHGARERIMVAARG